MNELMTWRIIAWAISCLWVLGNITLLSLPLPEMYRIVPSLLFNGLFGAGTIIVWSQYNKVRESVRSSKASKQMFIDEQAKQQRLKAGYVQNLTVDQSLFDHISQSDGQWIELDGVYGDVFKKGRRLRVHNDADYGMMQYIEVVDVSMTKNGKFLMQVKHLD